MLVGLWCISSIDYPAWQGALQKTSIKLLVWLLVASLCLHAWIGLRDVLMDYVKPVAIRLLLNVLVLLVLALCLVWASAILWGSSG